MSSLGNGATYLESLELHGEGVLNGLELRRDDGKNRGVDSVEFVEATPSTALTQTRKVLTDRLKEEQVATASQGHRYPRPARLKVVCVGVGRAAALEGPMLRV